MPTENITPEPSFDLDTPDGGRGYIANLFKTALKRHDYRQYIAERLAGDFACTMAQHLERITAERDALQQRLNAADQRIDELTPPVSPDPVTWGAPKTVRQLIQQLQTLDQDLRPLSMLRVPGNVFDDGKERTRALHLSISHERADGQWLAPFKSEGEKVLAFWCRMERPAPAFGFPVTIDPTLAPDEIRLVIPTQRRTEEIQFKGMIETWAGKFAIMIDEANAHYGWTFQRHPDGMWVSGRKATEAEMHAARTHARITNQQ
ncbi:hypothetical protein FQ192_10695 [Pseudomonas sp. ANT_J12]|uniref:hypothetical protein n=1 Tax=Pseudomonas sp. ANT_J12 TaxID=2597351 RepID=UPI0011F299B4|nr:hypothetical protein [Pseudomonas sp. ANT_J12]KAA0995498.1 hypothetical protein FQ192_10695 [Pseudomonas sp. ANT_J12]